MTLSEARVSQAWQSRDIVSTSGTMVNTWLTGSGCFGLRSRALTRGSVISESLEISTVSKTEGSGELWVVFFMAVLLAESEVRVPCRQQPWFLVMHELTAWWIYYQKIQFY